MKINTYYLGIYLLVDNIKVNKIILGVFTKIDMDKEKFKAYFLKKASAKQSDDQGEEDIFVTKAVYSAANVATNADVDARTS